MRGVYSALMVGAALAGLVYACASVSRTFVAPPQIAGAEFVGSETCADCHESKVTRFQGATHALLVAQGANVVNIGCESCHGPGSVHEESGGERGTIVNPRRSPEACFQCHLDKRAEFSLPHTHPVAKGPLELTTAKVSCVDCHNPHEGSTVIAGGTEMASQADVCGKCHVAQRGPFVYEHEAMREGCVTCHSPHGSPNAKMLTERNATLCLKCHFQEQTDPNTILIGGRDHSSFLSRGTCFSAGCHEAIHGSNVDTSLRF